MIHSQRTCDCWWKVFGAMEGAVGWERRRFGVGEGKGEGGRAGGARLGGCGWLWLATDRGQALGRRVEVRARGRTAARSWVCGAAVETNRDLEGQRFGGNGAVENLGEGGGRVGTPATLLAPC